MLPAWNGTDRGHEPPTCSGSTRATPRSAPGPWKLVRKHGSAWELYAIESDRAEAHDLAAEHPDVVADLAARYEAWAERCGVIPREVVLDLYARRGKGLPPE